MPIVHVVDQTLKLVRATWSGQVTAPEVAEAWTKMFTDADALAQGRSLTDVRGAEPLFNGEQLRALVVDVGAPLLAGRKWRDAIVVDRPALFGVSRQFSVFTESVAAANVFYDEAEALRWLLSNAP